MTTVADIARAAGTQSVRQLAARYQVIPPISVRDLLKRQFLPIRDGFAFANDFKDWVFGSLSQAGRCGGMVYAALDYFYAGRPIPSGTSLPPDGSVLSTYIWDRNYTSVWSDTFWDFAGRILGNPFGNQTASEFQNGITVQFPILKARLDFGIPTPLGLVYPSGDLFTAIPNSHQVLAIGYRDNPSNPGELAIIIYEPNIPGRVCPFCQLVPDPVNFRWVETTSSGDFVESWLTYFVNTDYTGLAPPPDLTDIVGKDWSNRDLSGLNLTEIDCRRGNFTRTLFRGADLHLADFTSSLCNEADFTGANLFRTNFEQTNATGASFFGADLRNAVLRGGDFAQAKFIGARMGFLNESVDSGMVSFDHCDLQGADLSLAKLPGAKLTYASVVGAKLGTADLRGATFDYADLHGADLSGADLSAATFVNSIAYGADLTNAKLFGTRFDRALLYGADLRNASAVNASFREADLHGADFRGVDATGADFTGSSRQGCDFSGATLTGAIGLT